MWSPHVRNPKFVLLVTPGDKTWNMMLPEEKQPNVLECNEVGNVTRRPTHALLNTLRDANTRATEHFTWRKHTRYWTLHVTQTHALLNTLRDANTRATEHFTWRKHMRYWTLYVTQTHALLNTLRDGNTRATKHFTWRKHTRATEHFTRRKHTRYSEHFTWRKHNRANEYENVGVNYSVSSL